MSSTVDTTVCKVSCRSSTQRRNIYGDNWQTSELSSELCRVGVFIATSLSLSDDRVTVNSNGRIKDGREEETGSANICYRKTVTILWHVGLAYHP